MTKHPREIKRSNPQVDESERDTRFGRHSSFGIRHSFVLGYLGISSFPGFRTRENPGLPLWLPFVASCEEGPQAAPVASRRKEIRRETRMGTDLLPFLTFSTSDSSLSTLPRIINVLMNIFCAVHLPTPSPPCLASLANRPPRLGGLPRRLRETPPQVPRPTPPQHRRHRPILPPLW
jgi:hypothetical protein